MPDPSAHEGAWAEAYHRQMARSGLIVEVAAAEPVVGQWRNGLDPQARLGVPPHVTVLYPFVPPNRLDEETLVRLRELISPLPGFSFDLVRTGWFDDGAALWLAPRPAEPFRQLTATLTHGFPDYPPYGGQHAEVVPHLTVGVRGSTEQLRRAEQEVQQHLPIRACAGTVTLMVERPDGRWHRHTDFDLAG